LPKASRGRKIIANTGRGGFMLKEVLEFYRPQNIEEAYDLLLKHSPHVQLVGGGLDLIWRERKGAKYLIGLDSLPLKFVRLKEGLLEIGAMVTIRELSQNEAVQELVQGAFQEALKTVATPLLRGVITLGGALVQAYPWSDIPSLILGLDGQVEFFQGEYRILNLSEFYKNNFRQVLKQAILTRVLIPFVPERYFSFRRFTRTSVDIPLLNQAVSLDFKGGKVRRARVILGSRPGFPLQFEEIERHLEGKELTEGLILEAVLLAREKAPVDSDFRISQEFRRNLTGVLLEENLREIRGKYEGQVQA
jgi:CO/xanthine dehydrogenase FAD-binding subunit